MPGHGDGAQFLQSREPLARFFVSFQRLFVSALIQADGSKLEFSDGDLPVVTEFLRPADASFVSGSRFVEPAQAEKTVAAVRDADGRHSLRPATGPVPLDGLEACLRLVQQRQDLFRSAGVCQHSGQRETCHRQIVICGWIRLRRLAGKRLRRQSRGYTK